MSHALVLFGCPSLATGLPVLAYLGPGAGLSAIGTILAFVVVVLLLTVGFLWYPLKRLMRARKAKAAHAEPPPSPESDRATNLP
jgi:hypothetical protein